MNGAAPPGGRDALALLRLFQLVSPALPIGAYAYSQGLETAVQQGWVHDEASALQWLQGLAERSVASLDLPILARLMRAGCAGDAAQVAAWNDALLAARETRELRAEERQLGAALLRILAGLQVDGAQAWLARPCCLANGYALAARAWELGEADALCAYLWSWTENQVLAAVKLVPLGQSAGQRLLFALGRLMPAWVARARSAGDDDIGVSTVAQALASALHETQYSRLFRS